MLPKQQWFVLPRTPTITSSMLKGLIITVYLLSTNELRKMCILDVDNSIHTHDLGKEKRGVLPAIYDCAASPLCSLHCRNKCDELSLMVNVFVYLT